jgi:hypothetical protein
MSPMSWKTAPRMLPIMSFLRLPWYVRFLPASVPRPADVVLSPTIRVKRLAANSQARASVREDGTRRQVGFDGSSIRVARARSGTRL